ncbi:major facilitator superfamily protein [Diplodia corticola]|uniref:Major facilitator superfamily protein n=1 Tax=Diplodia corticola TaxID=236234 RepID=A0A1J9QZ62_9PEZI|nr:major facilitator superfamily protein [Diplodia corticola]OJD33665.1 major facilitator superfamily protein [Diplodia corticola]
MPFTDATLPEIPEFDALTLDPRGPPGNAWGLFGDKDELGMLNLLTPETVAAAAKEIKTGMRFSLDLPLNQPAFPSFGRQPFHHEIRQLGDRTVNDDIVSFNTQSSSQWDGFRHYGNQNLKCYFMGHTQDDILKSDVIGTNAWLHTGGIQGRAILLDYPSWASSQTPPLPLPSPFTSTAIPLSHIQRLLASRRIVPRRGDILLLRTGLDAALKALSADEQRAVATRAEADFVGLQAGRETLRWLWEAGPFAAVASDAPSFERAPVLGAHAEEGFTLHQWLLAGWGCPIGELFDLEGLAAACEREGRWEVFFSSVPLKVPGGVASPPNAVAIM